MKKLGITLIIIVGLITGGLIAVLVIGINAGGWNFMNTGNGDNQFLMELANRQEWSAKDLKRLDVEYKSDSIRIFESEGDTVVLEEYFSRWDPDMLARTTENAGEITIRGGERKWQMMMLFFRIEIRLYVPRTMAADAIFATHSGSVKSDVDLEAKSFDISTTSGSLRMAGLTAENGVDARCSSGGVHLDSVRGKTVNLKCTSGSIRVGEAEADTLVATNSSGGIHIDTLSAVFDVSTKSGTVDVGSCTGHGKAKASSGGVRVAMRELTGDLDAATTSGSVKVSLPRDTGLDFYAKTNSGSIHTDFDGALQFNEKKNEASGQVGDAPFYKVRCEASSGSVRVTYD